MLYINIYISHLLSKQTSIMIAARAVKQNTLVSCVSCTVCDPCHINVQISNDTELRSTLVTSRDTSDGTNKQQTPWLYRYQDTLANTHDSRAAAKASSADTNQSTSNLAWRRTQGEWTMSTGSNDVTSMWGAHRRWHGVTTNRAWRQLLWEIELRGGQAGWGRGMGWRAKITARILVWPTLKRGYRGRELRLPATALANISTSNMVTIHTSIL